MDLDVEICKELKSDKFAPVSEFCKRCSKLEKKIDVLEKKIESLKESNSELKEKNKNLNLELAELKKRKKVIPENVLNLSKEKILKLASSHYTKEMFLKGQKGISEFIIKHVITDENKNVLYKCKDLERKKFVFNDGKEIIEDINFKILVTTVYRNMYEKIAEVYKLFMSHYDNEFNSEGMEELKDSDELSKLEETTHLNSLIKKELGVDNSDDQLNTYLKVFLDIKKIPTNRKQITFDLIKFFETV